MSNKSIIFQSPFVSVISQPGETSGILITFNELGSVVNGDRFWGDALCQKLGISAIGVMTTTPNWYPEQDMIEALEAVRGVTGDRRVVTYGHSQGAYGALKFSKAVNASAVFAFCPQWSINPDDVKAFDPRFHHYYRPKLRNGLRIEEEDVVANSYLLFDPRERVDVWNADKILQIPGTRAVCCPFSGHETVRLPAESRQAASLIALFMTEGRDYAVGLRKLMRQSRENSPTYHRNRCKGLLKANKFSRVEKLLPNLPSEVVSEARIVMAIADQRFTEAEQLILSAPFSVVKSIGIIRCWTICRDNGLRQAELRIACDIVSEATSDAFVRLHAVTSFANIGLLDDARTELRKIVDRFGLKIGADHIKNLSRRLEMPEIEARFENLEMS